MVMKGDDPNSAAASSLVNMVLWMFIPQAVTNFLLRQYYWFKYAKNSPSIPKPTSTKHKNNYKICYTLVISVYFAYCLGQTIYSLEESYYSKIGVNRSRLQSDLRRRSRQLLIMYHPDKVSGGSGNMDKYLELKGMVDVLENQNLCNIYEKFGDSGVTTVQQVSSKKKFTNANEIRKEYIYATIIEWITFYSGTLIAIILLGFTKKSDSDRYWRLVFLLLLATYESYLYFVDFTTIETISQERTMLSFTSPLSWISFCLASIPIFQRIKIIRQIFIYIGLASSQLWSLWCPVKSNLLTDKKVLLEEIEKIEKNISSDLYNEALFVFNSAFGPFKTNEEMKALLKRQMGQIVIDLSVLESMNAAANESTSSASNKKTN